MTDESLAKRRARNRKFNEKTYEHITVNLKKGQKEQLKEFSMPRYGSVQGFVIHAIKEQIRRDLEEEKLTGKQVYHEPKQRLPEYFYLPEEEPDGTVETSESTNE